MKTVLDEGNETTRLKLGASRLVKQVLRLTVQPTAAMKNIC